MEVGSSDLIGKTDPKLLPSGYTNFSRERVYKNLFFSRLDTMCYLTPCPASFYLARSEEEQRASKQIGMLSNQRALPI